MSSKTNEAWRLPFLVILLAGLNVCLLVALVCIWADVILAWRW